MNREYIANSIAALFRMRRETDRSLDKLGDRLEFANTAQADEIKVNAARRPDALNAILGKMAAIFDLLKSNIILARRLSSKVREYRDIRFVGISLKRLPIPLDNTVLQSLETLTFTNKGVPLVRGEAGLTILLDPANALSVKKNDLAENVVLATPVSIIFAASPRLLLSLFTEILPLYLAIRSRAPEVSKSAAVPMCLCVVAMECLFRTHDAIDYTLTTSNSVLLEATRFWAMQADRVRLVREIMHGIPVPAVDRYFGSISASALNRLELVRQVPLQAWQPPDNTRSDELLFCNLAVNKMFLLKIGQHAEWSIEKLHEYVTNQTHQNDDRTHTAVIFGGNHSSEPFFKSQNFLVEKLVLEKTRSSMAKLHSKPHIVYLPHPGHGKLDTSVEDVIYQFVDEISYNSQPWYFTADYAAGLYSSGLFELAALGAKVFSPVLPSDEIYHAAMMADMLTTPTDPGREGIASSLLHLMSLLHAADRKHDVRNRLRVLYPTIT